MNPLHEILSQYRPGGVGTRLLPRSGTVPRRDGRHLATELAVRGHSCQAPQPGDYFVYDVDGDSIIVVRREDGSIGAMHNVCRHRGSLIATEPAGQTKRFVCPYHQWAYGLGGRLLTCRNMPPETDKSRWGSGRYTCATWRD